MRKLRLLATLAALAAAALPAAAQLEKFKDWDKSPEFVYYATDDEKQAWGAVKTDEEAQKFNNLFWGKRHANYQTTQQNVFRSRFDALVAEADKRFPLGKKRGALTERGKAFILLGPPTGIGSRVENAAPAAPGAGEEASLPSGMHGKTILMQFQYDETTLPAWAGTKKLNLTFTIDEGANTESLDKAGDLKKLWKKAVAAAVVNPKMTEPPHYKTREEYEAEQKAAAEAAAEAAKGPVLSAEVRTALEAVLAKEPHGDLTAFPIAYGDKATRLMVQLPVPADLAPAAPAAPAPAAPAAGAAPAPAAPAAPAAKVAVLVKGKDGKDAARREEAPNPSTTKADRFVEWSFAVEPGDYDVAVVLFDASGAQKATARRTVKVDALPSGLGISQLLLAAADLPAEGSKGDEPFTFATRKFVARGDNALRRTDGLSYLARVYNPAVDPATRKLQLTRAISIKPKGGSAIEVPQPGDEPMAVPEQQGATTALVIDIAGAIVDEKLGDYFRAGEYTMTLKITDAVANKTIETKATFTIPAAPAPAKPAAPPAPAPKAPTKK